MYMGHKFDFHNTSVDISISFAESVKFIANYVFLLNPFLTLLIDNFLAILIKLTFSLESN